jgi:hypothetical protein
MICEHQAGRGSAPGPSPGPTPGCYSGRGEIPDACPAEPGPRRHVPGAPIRRSPSIVLPTAGCTQCRKAWNVTPVTGCGVRVAKLVAGRIAPCGHDRPDRNVMG